MNAFPPPNCGYNRRFMLRLFRMKLTRETHLIFCSIWRIIYNPNGKRCTSDRLNTLCFSIDSFSVLLSSIVFLCSLPLLYFRFSCFNLLLPVFFVNLFHLYVFLFEFLPASSPFCRLFVLLSPSCFPILPTIPLFIVLWLFPEAPGRLTAGVKCISDDLSS